MKFRPQMQLRFRSETQFNAAKEIASKTAPSMNEWILQQVEKLNPGLSDSSADPATSPAKKVNPKAKAKEVKPDAIVCPFCKKSDNTKPWGPGGRCDDCKRNF